MAIELPPDVEPSAFCICHHNPERARVSSATLRQAQDCNYDALTVPITTYAFHARVQSLISNHLYTCQPSDHTTDTAPTVPPLSSLDTHLEPADHVRHLLGVISPWIDLTSPDPSIYHVSCQILDMEVDFAAFCGLRALLLPAPRLRYGSDVGQGTTQYARAVSEAMKAAPQIDFSVTMPMMDDPNSFEESETNLSRLARPVYSSSSDSRRPSMDSTAIKHDFFGTWDAWNVIRSFCGYNPHLFVGLAIPHLLPPSSICSRWHSEPLQVLLIDSTTFTTNKGNYPVLTANHRALISQYMKLRNPSGTGLIPPIVILTGVDPIPGNPYTTFGDTNGSTDPDVTIGSSSLSINPTPSEAYAIEAGSRFGKHKAKDKSLAHLTYLRWFQQNQPPRTTFERQTAGWQEYLQVPLNPLADNLDSITYEVFEQDPIKYDRYEEAIRNALLDWQKEGKESSGLHDRVVVAVVGAGRGPLVERARKASAATGVAIELWALEKNPNAWVLLQRHNADRWHGQVNLVKSDMRSWKGPARLMENETGNGYHDDPSHTHNSVINYPIDIVVSELLGSFGDNELSPECLDPIMPLLNPTHGISIPQSYSAHLTPIAAPKLHAKILADTKYDASAPNIPYVVHLHSFDHLSTTSHLSAYGPDHTPVPRTGAQQANGSNHRATATTNTSSTTPSLFAAISPEEEGIHITKPPAPLVQEAWSFHHHPPSPPSLSTSPPTALPAFSSPSSPSTISNSHNARHARLTFPLRHRAACHGLAGYFEARLYGDVRLATNPLTMAQSSPDMMSWFPIFFPLQRPLYTPDQSTLVVEMWRVCKAGKVWYEWVVEGWCKGVRVGSSEVGGCREKGMLL